MTDSEKSTDQLLLEILKDLQRGENCWCDMAIGNPMLRDHTDRCKRAQAAFFRLNNAMVNRR